MVSGWAVPVRVGNKVLAVLEFYCHFLLREDQEAMAAIETVARFAGPDAGALAGTRTSRRADRQQEILLDSVADGICGVDRHGLVSFANPAAGRLLGAPAASLTGKPVHDLLHGSARGRTRGADRIAPCARATERHVATAGEDTIYRSRRQLLCPRSTSSRRFWITGGFRDRCSASATSASAMRSTG